MPVSTPAYGRPTSVSINPDAFEAMGYEAGNIISASAIASAAWPSANLSIMYPFSVSQPWTARTMFLYNGTTAQDHMDLGIYDDAGTLLVSKGSTVQAGTSALQILDITDTVLVPGKRYYAAAAMDGTTAHALRRAPANASQLSIVGMVQVASNFPLATGVTFAACANAYQPWFGVSMLTVY